MDDLSAKLVVARQSSPFRKAYTIDWEVASEWGEAFVAAVEQTVVGFAATRWSEWNRRMEVVHLYADTSVRGEGIGTALLNAIVAKSASVSDRLWVETQNVNAPAIEFYLRHGFQFSGFDTSLYDPLQVPGETAVFFSRSLP